MTLVSRSRIGELANRRRPFAPGRFCRRTNARALRRSSKSNVSQVRLALDYIGGLASAGSDRLANEKAQRARGVGRIPVPEGLAGPSYAQRQHLGRRTLHDKCWPPARSHSPGSIRGIWLPGNLNHVPHLVWHLNSFDGLRGGAECVAEAAVTRRDEHLCERNQSFRIAPAKGNGRLRT